MSQIHYFSKNARDTVLFVGRIRRDSARGVEELSKILGKKLEVVVLLDSKDKEKNEVIEFAKKNKYKIIETNTHHYSTLQKSLGSYIDRILLITCQTEKHIPVLKRMIPQAPYVNTPTETSLDWSTEKIKMRQRLENYNRKVTPRFLVANNYDEETIQKIEKQINFPLVIKPSGLASSLLVSICYHREELRKNLKRIFKDINKVYARESGRGEIKILVEQVLEGPMYTLDAYINADGVIYFCPLVHVKTGRAVGFDDFFGYQQLTPVRLKSYKHEGARKASEDGIRALGLRSTTVHVELIKTEDGWKIIELGPRIGGFRNYLYEKSYGIDHPLNDMLIRLPHKPKIPKRTKGYSAIMKFFGKSEGRLKSIDGVKKAKHLDSVVSFEVNKKPGDRCIYAKHGGRSVITTRMFNEKRSELLADIRRLETDLVINIV